MVLVALTAGCRQDVSLPEQTSEGETELFDPAVMRIHPVFTQIKDFGTDGKPDGVEALLEFQDQFSDPTKASGVVLFELFEYRRAQPDPRGRRLALWSTTVTSLQEQRQRWNRTSRTYTFQLDCQDLRPDSNYVLTATFQSSTGIRFFDRTILRATAPSDEPASTQPSPRS
jgi:hypothetical protein